ncbi:unnamed protein product, partial [Urochloa humidicola]
GGGSGSKGAPWRALRLGFWAAPGDQPPRAAGGPAAGIVCGYRPCEHGSSDAHGPVAEPCPFSRRWEHQGACKDGTVLQQKDHIL